MQALFPSNNKVGESHERKRVWNFSGIIKVKGEGEYYLVTYKGELWPGQLIKPTKSGAIIRCLQKTPVTGSIWRWPNKPNEGEYRMEDVCQEIEAPSN